MLEEGGEAADLGFGVAIRVKDSGECSRYEVLPYAILAKSAPFDVPKKNMAHRVEKGSYRDREVFVEVRLPAALIEPRDVGI